MSSRGSTRKYLAAKMAEGAGFRVRTQGDSKVCAHCRAMAGKYKNNGGDGPPYHPNCRCSK